MRVYAENECVFFYRTAEPFGELSNMHRGFPILYDGILWKSSEALYQALRYPGRTDIHAAINAEENAMLAKRKAYEWIDETRPDWEDVKVGLMEMVLRLKIAQHFDRIHAVLLNAGTRDIVEKSRGDGFWGAQPDGDGNLVGENVLGLLWTLLWHEIKAGIFHSDVTLPL